MLLHDYNQLIQAAVPTSVNSDPGQSTRCCFNRAKDRHFECLGKLPGTIMDKDYLVWVTSILLLIFRFHQGTVNHGSDFECGVSC